MKPDSRAIKVGLVQINNSFSNQNYLPYSVGILQAHARKYLKRPDHYEFLLPIYHRMCVEEAVRRLEGAQMVLFSTYVWNIRLSLEIARAVKERNVEVIIVFGGPQVPDRAEGFLRKHPFVDVCCHGEGEQVFVALLEKELSREWNDIPGISFLDREASFVCHSRAQRLRDLSLIPSPYLEGIFDPLMRTNPKEQWLVLWETNRGCPFSCTFCDWGSAVQNKVFTFGLDRLFREVDWFAQHGIEFVFCCDANFGILKRDLEIVEYVAQTRRRYGYPRALSVQNTKNATERAYKVQKILADAGLNKGVTISLQSVDPNTLRNIQRQNISVASFDELQRRFTGDGVETYTDMILGLPGETYESFANGVGQVVENGQHNRIQFNNLSILPNAVMGDPEYRAKYGMETVETRIVNIHGVLDENEDGMCETQDLVMATGTMPRRDWCRTRAFCWMVALLHFDKVLQIPLVLLRTMGGVGYRELFEVFSERALDGLPILAEVRKYFLDKAEDIQNGGAEYCRSEAWLNIWWPADEYILIKLVVEKKLGRFYEEAERVLERFLDEKFIDLPRRLLHEAVLLNGSLLKQPFQTEDLYLDLSYNIWEFYQGAVGGKGVPIKQKPSVYHVDRTSVQWRSLDEWCREVIWYGNKRGAYLYSSDPVERQIAGHY